MVQRIPPPPPIATRDPALNRWLLELTSILNANGQLAATAVTQPVGTNNTDIATCAFVLANSASAPSNATPQMDGVGAPGVSTQYSRGDHVHPSDTSRAPLVSPALTGTPTAPTQAANDNSTKLATTAYVATAIAPLVGALVYQGTWNATTNTPALASGVGTKGFLYKVSVAGSTLLDGISQWNVGDQAVFNGTTWDKIDGIPTEVTSVAGRVGAVALAVADVSGAAPLASPALTGTPTAPTPASGSNNTDVATTAFVAGFIKGFSVSLSADETTTQRAYTKLSNFTAVNFDQTGNYSAATQRWTPLAGLVQLHLSVITTPTSVGSQVAVAIYKNGSVLHAHNAVVESSADSSAGLIPEVFCLDNANGTDYYEAYFYSGSPTPSALAQPSTFFEGLQLSG